MKIGIVNDLRIAVESLRRILLQVPEHEILWVAFDGQEAVKKCAEQTPDLVLMDLIMPVMNQCHGTKRSKS